jgi:acyl transferase domain-containing protein
LGDPIEINAAANVYGENRDPARPLLIGSVKTNVGHLEAAAGVAGLIKLVLAMQARVLPAHLHFTEPNPNIPWDRLPVKVTARTTPWGKAGKPMVAAISSFGASGTIAHAVVEEPPPSLPSFAAGEIANGREEVLVLSADSQEALRDLTQAYHDYLCDHTDLSILDLCYTAAACRAHLRYRRAVTGSSVSALRDKLARALEGESGSGIFLGHISTATASPSKQGAANLDPVTAGQQFVDGLTVVWEDLYPTRNPIALPTYPFQHVPYWVPLTETRSASNGLLYRCDWEPAEKRALVAASSPCHWVLISEVPDATKEVARRLEARHQPFATIQYGPRSVGRRTDRTDPSLDDALLKSLSNLPDRAPARILCFLEAETTHSAQVTTGTLGLNAAKSCQLLVDLVRSTSELSTTRDVRIWVVTRESQPFESADGISESRLAEPVAWGLGRTIATEHPDLFGGLIDIDCEPNAKTAEGLIDQVLLGTPQSSLRNGQTHVPRLHPIHEDAQQSETSPVIQSDATYLITGGLGALGKYLAHWLVDLGARNLILLSRRGERSDTGSDLDTIRSRGVRIWAPSTDVTRQEDVLTVMREIQRNWAPLLGIFHLAGVLDDRVVDRLDAESIACVLQPKVAGAWNLHLATADLPLDYFVLFSSLASWVGPAGQGSYAAANTFLDAVGRHRRATGLPSSTVSWGPWSGGGMWDSLDPVYRSQMRRSGIKPLSSDEALQALAVIMKNKISHAIVARIDWQEIFTTERPAFLRDWAGHLDPVGARPSKGQATDTDDMLSRDSLLVLDTTALARLTDFLAYLLAGILHLGSPGSIDVQRPLDEYGMDSLAATELRNRLASRLEVVLPVAQLIGGRSVLDLVDIIRDHLIAGGSADRSTQSADEDHETVEILI